MHSILTDIFRIKKRGEVAVEPPKEKEEELDADKIKQLMEKVIIYIGY